MNAGPVRTNLRIWLKPPHNGVYCDVVVPAGVELTQIISNWKIDGYLVGNPTGIDGAPFIVPWDSWSFAAFLVVNAGQTIVPWSGLGGPKPN